MSQSTSKNTKSFIPENRDPRYFRPTYTFHDTSTDSITKTTQSTHITQSLTYSNELNLKNVTDRICDICNKILPTKKGLKLHKTHCLRKREATNLSQNSILEVDHTFVPESKLKDKNGSHVLDSTLDFSNLISDLKRSIPILKRVPKGARTVTAEKLSIRITNCLSTNSIPAWISLMLFSYQCLRVPEKDLKQSLTTLVKNNVHSEELPKIKPLNFKKANIQQKVMKKIEDYDTKGALRIITSNDSVAEVNDQNYLNLLDMHPSATHPPDLPTPPDSTSKVLKVDENQVHKSILSFPNGSSSGIDGISPQHLKDLISKSANDQGKKLLENITKLVNFMLEGKVNDEILKFVYGANLCALNKKDGGLRPIAVGCVFRRLTGKLCCQAVQEKSRQYFQPYQLGFASKRGCEAVIHATRTFIKERQTSNDILVKIDYKNAFNCVKRDILLENIKKNVPELYHFLWQCYASPSLLFFGNRTISSQVGCQQGDPTGPLIFSLAIHQIILKLNANLKLFYLDDGTISGDAESVLKDVNTLITESQNIGLTINPKKCELFFISGITDDSIKSGFEKVLNGIRTVSSSELNILGSPICSEGFLAPLQGRFESLKLMIERLKDLPIQVAYFLIKNSIGIPKMLYTMRTTPTFMFIKQLKTIDDEIKLCLEGMLNMNLTQTQIKQARLPINYGGVGIRSILDLSLPTFLSSCAGVMSLVSNILQTPVDKLTLNFWSEGIEMWCKDHEELPENTAIQSQWDAILLNNTIEKHIKFDNPLDIARMKAVQNKESGAWLHAFPSKNTGMLMDDSSFRICIGLRLGCDLCREYGCKCGEIVDVKGLHPLSCFKNSGRHHRHADVNNILKRALASADIPAQLEPIGLNRSDGKRPDGVTIVPWAMGKCLVWDFTCSNTLASSYLASTKERAGAAAELAVSRKHQKYEDIKARGLHLVVFAAETMGPWCEEAKEWMKVIGKKLIKKTGEPKARFYLMQRISMSIQMGNAASILTSLPSERALDNIFYL